MVPLAELLDDNAALHKVHGVLAPSASREWPLREAIAHVEALGARADHEATREACLRVREALAGLETLLPAAEPAAIESAIREVDRSRADPHTSLRERDVLLVRRDLLAHRLRHLAQGTGPEIPRIVHLVKTDSAGGDLPLFPFLCYRSILAHCRDYRVVLHAPARPRGERWERLMPHLEIDIALPPQWLADRRLLAAAHQSDVWRARALLREGGFYFDWDLLLLRPPDGLRAHPCVMALERREEGYLEVMGVSAIGAVPGSAFLQAWLEAMPSVFNPARYVAHSTVLARELALRLPSLVRVLGHRAFYHPGWTQDAMAWLLDPSRCLPPDELQASLAGCTGIHLFCSHAHFRRWADSMTEADIARPRCNLATLMQPHL